MGPLSPRLNRSVATFSAITRCRQGITSSREEVLTEASADKKDFEAKRSSFRQDMRKLSSITKSGVSCS